MHCPDHRRRPRPDVGSRWGTTTTQGNPRDIAHTLRDYRDRYGVTYITVMECHAEHFTEVIAELLSLTTFGTNRTPKRHVTMSIFVLVHGACHDGSAWRAVIQRLTERGHTAFGPTVAGHGPGATKHVTHAQSTRSIVDFIVERDLTDVVLVGHSYGGSIISKVVEVIPDRIRWLVFWSAFVLNDGESMLETFPPVLQEMLTRLAAGSSDNTVTLPFPVWREYFMNDAVDDLARRAYDLLSPAPFGQLLEPLDLKKFHSLPTPRSYLVGTEDLVPQGDCGWHARWPFGWAGIG